MTNDFIYLCETSNSMLTNEIKFRLLAGRLARDYANSPDSGMYYGPRKVHVNLDNVWKVDNQYISGSRIHLFAFGAYASTFVLAFGSLESALEDAAATLKEVAPGCFTEPDYAAAREEIMGESGCGDDMISEDDSSVQERAEADLVYTESGWLAAWECTIVAPGWTPEQIRKWARNER